MTIATDPEATGPAETGIPGFPVATVGAYRPPVHRRPDRGKEVGQPHHLLQRSRQRLRLPVELSGQSAPGLPPAERPADGGGAPGAWQHVPHRQVRISRILGRGLHQPRRQLLRRGHRLHHPAVRQQHRRRHRLCLLSRQPCRRRRRLVRRLGRQPGAGQLRQLHRHPRDRPRARAEARPRDLGLRGAALRHRLDGILGDDLQLLRRVGREVRLQRDSGATPRPS